MLIIKSKVKLLFLFVLLFVFSQPTFSQLTDSALIGSKNKVDPLNTYQWNRKNWLRKNSLIDNSHWFEWWYYKIVLPKNETTKEDQSFYFVYGVVNPWDLSKPALNPGSRSYVGMGDFNNKEVIDINYEVDQFSADYESTQVNIHNNYASANHFYGSLSDSAGHVHAWDIKIKKNWSFNATGWITGKGYTNIEWYPAQADALCSGMISSQGELTKFKNAPCYQDRNWGNSFPQWWTWIVSNHFEGSPETALAIGGGRPELFDKDFGIEGVAVGFRHKGEVYEFRPNKFDIMSIDINYGKWYVEAENFKYKIKIVATADKSKFMDLQFVTPQGDTFHDYETLTGEVTVELYEKEFSLLLIPKLKLITRSISNYAGIEYGSHEEQAPSFESLQHMNFNIFNSKTDLK